MTNCIIDGCDTTAFCKQMCRMHYARAARGTPLDAPKRGSLSFNERFWSFVDRRSKDECWLWLGGTDPDGYGIFSHHGKSYRAHRVVLQYSRSLSRSQMACHHCDNPPCCNPEHLFVGVAADNTHDMVQKGRYKNGRAILTEEMALSIRSNYTGQYGEVARLARKHGLSHAQMLRVCHGKAWNSCG